MVKKVDEHSRNDAFCEKTSTSIWQETPSTTNPYTVSEARCHGYEHLALINNRSYTEVLFLMFQGELPTPEQHQLFEHLLTSLIHPGPRHNACRAAMNAAVSKTHVSHILPLSLNVLSGEQGGSHEVFQAMKYLQNNQQVTPRMGAQALTQAAKILVAQTDEGDIIPAPGFGTFYGSIDNYTQKIADNVFNHCSPGPHLRWAHAMLDGIDEELTLSWRIAGLAGACLLDLGFTPYTGELIFQIACAPGIAAQAAEKSNSPITEMPFLAEENYVIK
ncbi:citrate synthase family protein [Neptuniibacter marinus]|uniref:citrate/2-methylcitrate synthase n=1 Tax=Neptuniibacter marinus TaxID=1806670 RepID=UPI00082C64EF|nr:citrate/2-methylcitrate synthase [Neptuniibacter marinus]